MFASVQPVKASDRAWNVFDSQVLASCENPAPGEDLFFKKTSLFHISCYTNA